MLEENIGEYLYKIEEYFISIVDGEDVLKRRNSEIIQKKIYVQDRMQTVFDRTKRAPQTRP